MSRMEKNSTILVCIAFPDMPPGVRQTRGLWRSVGLGKMFLRKLLVKLHISELKTCRARNGSFAEIPQNRRLISFCVSMYMYCRTGQIPAL